MLLLTLAATGCSTKEQPLPGMTDTAWSGNGVDPVGQVASDKDLLRKALLLADTKGTLVAGLSEAAKDSLIGIKMREALILSNRPIPANPVAQTISMINSPVVHKVKPVQHAVKLDSAHSLPIASTNLDTKTVDIKPTEVKDKTPDVKVKSPDSNDNAENSHSK